MRTVLCLMILFLAPLAVAQDAKVETKPSEAVTVAPMPAPIQAVDQLAYFKFKEKVEQKREELEAELQAKRIEYQKLQAELDKMFADLSKPGQGKGWVLSKQLEWTKE